MNIVTANIAFEFSNEDVDLHIMGSGCMSYPWWQDASEVLTGYFIKTADPDTGKYRVETLITFNRIREVMGGIISGWYDYLPEYSQPTTAKTQLFSGLTQGDFDLDSDGADQILQVACFGKVVYG